MSVALVLTRSDADADEYQPVATEGTFIGLWLPVIRALGLVWMPLFESGVDLTREDIAAVLVELSAFAREVAARSETRPDYTHVHQRAVALAERLERLQHEPFDGLFIG